MKKVPYVFKIPIATEATATAKRNGARMRVIVTARSSLSGVNPAAYTRMIHGANRKIPSVTAVKTTARTVRRRFASLHAASLPSCSLIAVKVGMNADDRAPSAKRSLNRLGMRNAARNASVTNPAPK